MKSINDHSNGLLSTGYRKDIDALRALAVTVVFLFHLGFLPNGYLGVDIFFVISGYLITKIIYNGILTDKFKIMPFYLRRARRIIPLILFSSSIALIIGIFVMLPDDLENLSQSIVATNFFSNNILLMITSMDYWNFVNDYKPLMHTWSLGIEEQFYIFYPIIFWGLKNNKNFILPTLSFLILVSLTSFLISSNEPSKFYSIHFRFFELALGGFGSLIFKKVKLDNRFKPLFIFSLLSLLFINVELPKEAKLILIVLATLGLLVSERSNNPTTLLLIENKVLIFLGRISFSVYIWHQIFIAFFRYIYSTDIDYYQATIITLFVLFVSVLSYNLIEQPFRNRNKIKTKQFLFITGFFLVLSTTVALYIYSVAGVLKDVPELNLKKSSIVSDINLLNVERNPHISYNARVYDFEQSFTDTCKTNTLVIGDSFARDWANILIESKCGKQFEISYVADISQCVDIDTRLELADYIFFSEISKDEFSDFSKNYAIDTTKFWVVGPKNFGTNNGVFYNKKGSIGFCDQRAYIEEETVKKNNQLKKQWGRKYIDLIELVGEENGTVPVFTPECKFISQDCRHLTYSGASYFGKLIGTLTKLNIKCNN